MIRSSLPLYQPTVLWSAVYQPHPGKKPCLRYHHDVDIVHFQGQYIAAWNANEANSEDVPGQFNFLSTSADFANWSPPVRMFSAGKNVTSSPAAEITSPVSQTLDNQWQPNFINWRDEKLFCAWCDFVARKTYVSTSLNGTEWTTQEVPPAPPELDGQVVGFPTNHGLVTSNGTLLFPCSLPFIEGERCVPGHTRYAGLLLSQDNGSSWVWSEPIEGANWSELGENPADYGGETIYLWEPMVVERPDASLLLLIRNSTAQEYPDREEKPHFMLLACESEDGGKTWTKAKPVEVDTICSRNFAVTLPECHALLMVHNDNHVRVPERIFRDRYHLGLFCAPVADPDLLLPGPVIQPPSGLAYYPNGFVMDDALFLAFTYWPGIHTAHVSPLPDFSRPFLMPRTGRPGLHLRHEHAILAQRTSALPLVLTAELTQQDELRFSFQVEVPSYDGNPFVILTAGGKTSRGLLLRVAYDAASDGDVFQTCFTETQGPPGWQTLGVCEPGRNQLDLLWTMSSFVITLNGADQRSHPGSILRKICFGDLYAPPEWPASTHREQDVRICLDTIRLA